MSFFRVFVARHCSTHSHNLVLCGERAHNGWYDQWKWWTRIHSNCHHWTVCSISFSKQRNLLRLGRQISSHTAATRNNYCAFFLHQIITIPRVNECFATTSTLHRRQLRVLFAFPIKRFTFHCCPHEKRIARCGDMEVYVKSFRIVELERNEFLERRLFSWSPHNCVGLWKHGKHIFFTFAFINKIGCVWRQRYWQ